MEEYNNIKFLPNECDFEMYLLNEGFDRELNIAMQNVLGEDYLDTYIKKKDHTSKGRERTPDICDSCNQNIYLDIYRDYSGDEGEKEALLDCIHNNKTAYSSVIADIIINQRTDDKIPKIISTLFKEINKDLKINDEVKDTEGVTV
ncbi:hypothetical protein [Bacillus coahuilensis]|uniref:hypothetical protein n=1 Tax=Bacillus coahuilensis TaxID=408580 RepID=UPI0001850E56|nr:hypothetical protein [Bacillus coahuilensis]